MANIKSLVKVDAEIIKVAVDNHNTKVEKLEKDVDEALLKYKDGYKFSWWDKVRGRHNWTSEQLLDFDRKNVGWYVSTCELLYMANLLTWEDYMFYHEVSSNAKDFLRNVLETGVSEVYLDAYCLAFVKDYSNDVSK